ncbi:MAG: alanine racemase [Patescibacteria group bacterium]
MLTWVEVDKEAIEFNLRQFRKLIGSDRLLMPVVKANAYGHGFLEVAKICDKSPQVDRMCVVNDDEAFTLTENKIRKPVQILTFYELDKTEKTLKLAKKGVIFPLFSLKQAIFLNKIGERAGKKIKVHIKVDTGASRVGLLPKEILPFLEKINKFSHLEIEGLFSHFAASEEDRIFTEHQMSSFEKIISDLEKRGYHIPIKHFACSSASVLYKKSLLNGVRLGLSLYGLYPDDLSKKIIKLQPALSWHTKIIQVRTLPAWTKIGYGGSFTTKRTTKIAVLPVGYWDGYDRGLSNKSFVLIGGKKCPIRGRICMNICMADVSAVKNVKAGDGAVLIGRQKSNSISADNLADFAGTINYEIVDRINPLILRKII